MTIGEGAKIGTGYTRNDTSNNIADGKTIDAADLDGEFDALVAAFDSTTGHTHDGTSAEGAPIAVTGPAQEYLYDGTAIYPKTDDTYDLGKAAAEWRNLYVDGTANIDSLVADTADINGGTVDGVVIGGASAGAITGTTITASTGFVGDVTGDVTGDITSSTSSSFADMTVSGNIAVDTDTFTVDSTTNRVGIGTASPSVPLHVQGNFNSGLFVEDDTSTNVDIVIADTVGSTRIRNASGAHIVYVGGDASSDTAVNSTQAFRIQSGGDIDFLESDGSTVSFHWDATNARVGIGTASPSHLLHVENSAGGATAAIVSSVTGVSQLRMGDTANSAAGRIDYDNSTNFMQFFTAGTEKVRVQNNGNVGIGTTTPSTTLDVNGTVTATAFAGNLTGDVTGNADTATTLTGLTSTVAELNYSDGVTSNIQAQLDAKAANTTQTTGTWEAGTGTTETIVSPAKVKAAIDALAPAAAGWAFTSSAQTITLNSKITVAHGLGSAPTEVSAHLICTTAQSPYNIGDVIPAPSPTQVGGSGYNVQLSADSTNIEARIGSQITLLNDSGAVVNLTAGSWQIYLKAKL